MRSSIVFEVKTFAKRAAAFTNYRSWLRRRRLRNRQFSIVSNDCWGAEVYKDLQLPFLTPFVGMMIGGPCYITLISDFERIVRSPLSFAETSRYDRFNELRVARRYPIGLLDGDVEIHFLHFASEEDAREKWTRRVGRILFDQVFYKLSYKVDDYFTEEHLNIFDSMTCLNRVIFSKSTHQNIQTCIPMSDFTEDGIKMYPISLRHFDAVAWFNGDLRRFRASA